MGKFLPYLWALTPAPLKTAEVQKVVETLASLLDDAKAAVFTVRRSWLPTTAVGAALAELGRARTLHQWPGETDAAYQARVVGAFDTYQKGGTNEGILLALELLGHPEATIDDARRQFRHDRTAQRNRKIVYGTRWAVFTVTVDLGDGVVTADHLRAIHRTIQRWKPAHAVLAYLVLRPAGWTDEAAPTDAALELSVDRTRTLEDLYAWPVALHDGTRRRDGTWQYNGQGDALEVEVVPA